MIDAAFIDANIAIYAVGKDHPAKAPSLTARDAIHAAIIQREG